MTVSEAIRAATAELETTSDTARLDAELLMAHAIGLSRSDVLIHWMDRPAPAEFFGFIGRRAKHEPVAYITGRQEFFGRPFKVTRDTLIPRPDSELIVESALELIGEETPPGRDHVLDLGTGSGALLLSVLAERPDLHGLGIDKSAKALAVAEYNAKSLGLSQRASFSNTAWSNEKDDWGYGWEYPMPFYQLVIANPPYVESDAELDAQVRDYEPGSALFAGTDGLDDYRILIPQLCELLEPEGAAILEIGATQAEAVAQMAQGEGYDVTLRKDLAGRPRCLVLR